MLGPGVGSDGLATTSGDGGAITLPSNPNGWGRYQIMYDRVFKCPPLPAAYDGTNGIDFMQMQQVFKINIKCNCSVNFTAGTGAVGSILDNSFHMIAATSNVTAPPEISYYARTSFTG